MKSIANFIFEKLKINKETGKKGSVKHIPSAIDSRVITTLKSLYYAQGGCIRIQPHLDKMKGYQAKNSDPKRLVNSIKDNVKLFARWNAAFRIQWDDAIMTFGDAIVDRIDGITIDNLHQFIRYNYGHNKENIDYYKNLYNIEFDE